MIQFETLDVLLKKACVTGQCGIFFFVSSILIVCLSNNSRVEEIEIWFQVSLEPLHLLRSFPLFDGDDEQQSLQPKLEAN